MSKPVRILWADDEIQLLKPQILFLQEKGMEVIGVNNGADALERVTHEEFDLVFLDENMPGLSGLETLEQMKARKPLLPVVMITKSEEENLMNEAIGSKISDYLIKPVNPNQVLLSVKKLLEGRRLVEQKTNEGYQRDFREIAMAFFDDRDFSGWVDIYNKLMHWDAELAQSADDSLREILDNQLQEANLNFGKFVSGQYLDWVNTEWTERPLLSPDLLPRQVRPLLDGPQDSVFFFLVDGMRYDHWRVFRRLLAPHFRVEAEDAYLSLLPTATQYARNSVFSGLFPLDIVEQHPKLWVHDDEEKGKNLHEEALLTDFLQRYRIKAKHSYTKLTTSQHSKDFEARVQDLLHNDLNVVVVNFLDMMAHARAEMSLIKELAPDEAAFRSLAESWMQHSSFFGALRKLAQQNVRIVLTTDHGVIRVRKPVKILGDRATSTNLRYKHGRNLNFEKNARMIFHVDEPRDARLPNASVSGSFAFALEDYFFVYPNQFNKFARLYAGTFQHGGVSLEEMLVPIVTLAPK